MKARAVIYLAFLIVLFGAHFGCGHQTAREDVPDKVQEAEASEALVDLVAKKQQFKGIGGWQDYSSLRLYEGGATSMFETANGELKISVITAFNKEFVLFFIPGAVYMNQGLSAELAADITSLEYIGIRSQVHLFILEQAFPGGPNEISETTTLTIEGKTKKEVQFIQGYMAITPPWKAEVTVSPSPPHRVDFVISLKTGPKTASKPSRVEGVWSDEPIASLLDDSTELDDWFVNYQRIRSWHRSGDVKSDTPIIDTNSFKTVGDIRRAVRAQMGQHPE